MDTPNVLSLTLFITVLVKVLKCEDVEVVSSFGRIRGIKVKINNGNDVVYQFRKIPYAVPPLGRLRFQKPVSHDPIHGVYDATEYGPSCMQTLYDVEKVS